MMTRKHFRAIADIICDETICIHGQDDKSCNGCLIQRNSLCWSFIHFLRTQNPNFDECKFEEACYGSK